MPRKADEKVVSVSTELHRELKKIAGALDVPIYALVAASWKPFRERLFSAAEEARGLLIKDPGQLPKDFSLLDVLPKPAFSDLTENERRWMQDLLNILRSGNPEVISAVTENIKVFRQFARLEHLEAPKKRAKG